MRIDVLHIEDRPNFEAAGALIVEVANEVAFAECLAESGRPGYPPEKPSAPSSSIE